MIVPILMYHSIDKHSGDYLTVSPGVFAEHVAYLADSFDAVAPRAIADSVDGITPLPRNPICITFDDSLQDNIEHAVPALMRRGMTAAFFAITSYLGGDTRWNARATRAQAHMSPDDLLALSRAGFEVGSHTATHPRLSAISDDAVSRELSESRAALTDLLGDAPAALSYPYGDAPPFVVRLAGTSYRVAFATTRQGVFSAAEDPLNLRRIYVSPADTSVSLAAKIADYQAGMQHG